MLKWTMVSRNGQLLDIYMLLKHGQKQQELMDC